MKTIFYLYDDKDNNFLSTEYNLGQRENILYVVEYTGKDITKYCSPQCIFAKLSKDNVVDISYDEIKELNNLLKGVLCYKDTTNCFHGLGLLRTAYDHMTKTGKGIMKIEKKEIV